MRTSDQRWGRLLRRTLQLGALGCGLWSAGCHKFEDCDLYKSCPGSLSQMAVAAAGDAGASCQKCLKTSGCYAKDSQCSHSDECTQGARCGLSTDPLALRECFRRFNEEGNSDGTELPHPWESSTAISFLQCLRDCNEQCAPPEVRWGCGDPIQGITYKLSADNPFFLQLSIVEYDPYQSQDSGTPADHSERDGGLDSGGSESYKIQVRFCRDKGNFERVCSEKYYSESERKPRPVAVTIDGSAEIEPHRLYLELMACEPDRGTADGGCTPLSESHPKHFPPTLYYPGVLLPLFESDKHRKQPLAIYLMPSALVRKRNSELGWGEDVLHDRAQSLVLPDSCIWERVSAPGVRIKLKERADLPLCFSSGTARCEGSDCPPCIWYADPDKLISTERTETAGAGAGIIGLEAGNYTIVATDSHTGNEIASRKVQMRPGWLTIVRTWPGMRAP